MCETVLERFLPSIDVHHRVPPPTRSLGRYARSYGLVLGYFNAYYERHPYVNLPRNYPPGTATPNTDLIRYIDENAPSDESDDNEEYGDGEGSDDGEEDNDQNVRDNVSVESVSSGNADSDADSDADSNSDSDADSDAVPFHHHLIDASSHSRVDPDARLEDDPDDRSEDDPDARLEYAPSPKRRRVDEDQNFLLSATTTSSLPSIISELHEPSSSATSTLPPDVHTPPRSHKEIIDTIEAGVRRYITSLKLGNIDAAKKVVNSFDKNAVKPIYYIRY